VVPVKKTYEKPHGGFLAIGPRYPGVLSDDSLTVLFTHPGDAQWTESLTSISSRRRPKRRAIGVGGNEPNAVILPCRGPHQLSG
jgi:hypothetical protein